eukprot:scaffold35779_cov69-Phaeocystis_antarctica.AAC.4
MSSSSCFHAPLYQGALTSLSPRSCCPLVFRSAAIRAVVRGAEVRMLIGHAAQGHSLSWGAHAHPLWRLAPALGSA